MRKMIVEWLKAAQDDLQTIEHIIAIKNSHIVAFHTQQAIEKSLKALIEEYEIDIPKIHKLVKLKKILNDRVTVDNDRLLKKLDDLYNDSRCPRNFCLGVMLRPGI